MTRAETTAAVRRRLVEAAIAQLADGGMRELTHRLVERRAGVSQGLAKYHFGNRDGLIEAVLEHMIEVELSSVMVVPDEAIGAEAASGEIPADIWQRAQVVSEEITSRPDLVRARFELYLHAAHQPRLQEMIRRGREQFVARTAESFSGDTVAARMVLAVVDGLLLHQISAPEPTDAELFPVHLIAAGMSARVHDQLRMSFRTKCQNPKPRNTNV